MSVLSSIKCLSGMHSPLRRRVEWDGRTYVTQCRHCGTPIERVAQNHWKKKVS